MIDFKSLEKFASEYGFSRVGVSSPRIEGFFIEKLEYWIEKGYQRGLEWFRRSVASRVDPVSALPWARSVLVFVDNYFCPDPISSGSERRTVYPGVSRYARGVDYHRFIRKRIGRVLKALQADASGLQWKVCVDTCPFLEKVYAVQAGLGWYGKNSLVIFPGLGSFCFIGIAFLNREVGGYKTPRVPDGCGDCVKCIHSCPAGAIAEPYFLDVGRCISFLTVEKKGAFSDREKELVARAGYVFGCDICQDVCPWNRKYAKKTHLEEYCAKSRELFRNLKEWERISCKEFDTLSRRSALKRAGYEGFKRNIEALKSSAIFRTVS